MIKKATKKERLIDLLGVLLFLIECSADEEERTFYDELANKIEQKLKEI